MRWRGVVNVASVVCAAVAIVAALVWCVSRVVGDPNVVAQFVYWMPTWAFAAGMLGAIAASWALAMLGRRSESEPEVYANPVLRRPRGRLVRRVGAGMALAMLGCVVVAEWRLWNAVVGPEAAARDRTVRVMNWNPTATFMETFPEHVARMEADVALVANPPAIVDWTLVRDGFGPSRDAVRQGRFAVISRYPVLRWGWCNLMVRGAEPVLQSTHKAKWLTIDTGQALWVELDTTAVLGRPMVVWIVDMPSEPRIGRARAFAEAAKAVREWKGPAMERSSMDAEAPMGAEAYAARFGGVGFPPPDVVVGDFNTPRGSPSIRRLVPKELRCAFGEAGYGPMGTWPRDVALLAIDQAFIAEWLRVTRYDVVDPTMGEHRAQVIEMTGR